MSGHTTVHKGFGKFMLESEAVVFEEKLPSYPPFPNAAYDFLTRNLERSLTSNSAQLFDGAAFVKDSEGEGLVKENSPILGELIAEKIDWSPKSCTSGELGTSGTPAVSIVPWQTYLVIAIDRTKVLGREPFEMCSECQKRHILWGPPVALQDRDTCLSILPGWFPTREFDRPWYTFIEYISKSVRFEERDQGRVPNPDRILWDKAFHEPADEWKAVGKHGGWWKCRTGSGKGETNVLMAQMQYRLCHRARIAEEEATDAKVKEDAGEKVKIQRWIKQCMKS